MAGLFIYVSLLIDSWVDMIFLGYPNWLWIRILLPLPPECWDCSCGPPSSSLIQQAHYFIFPFCWLVTSYSYSMVSLCNVTFILICHRLTHVHSFTLPAQHKHIWTHYVTFPLSQSFLLLVTMSQLAFILVPFLLEADMPFSFATCKIFSHFQLLYRMCFVWFSVHFLHLSLTTRVSIFLHLGGRGNSGPLFYLKFGFCHIAFC